MAKIKLFTIHQPVTNRWEFSKNLMSFFRVNVSVCDLLWYLLLQSRFCTVFLLRISFSASDWYFLFHMKTLFNNRFFGVCLMCTLNISFVFLSSFFWDVQLTDNFRCEFSPRFFLLYCIFFFFEWNESVLTVLFLPTVSVVD